MGSRETTKDRSERRFLERKRALRVRRRILRWVFIVTTMTIMGMMTTTMPMTTIFIVVLGKPGCENGEVWLLREESDEIGGGAPDGGGREEGVPGREERAGGRARGGESPMAVPMSDKGDEAGVSGSVSG